MNVKSQELYNGPARTPQDVQDEIFRNMSADEKIKLGSELWQLAKDLVGDKIDYGKNRSEASSNKNNENS